jgi:hypothetical protein
MSEDTRAILDAVFGRAFDGELRGNASAYIVEKANAHMWSLVTDAGVRCPHVHDVPTLITPMWQPGWLGCEDCADLASDLVVCDGCDRPFDEEPRYFSMNSFMGSATSIVFIYRLCSGCFQTEFTVAGEG